MNHNDSGRVTVAEQQVDVAPTRGTRVALLATAMYLLEWVVIIAFPAWDDPTLDATQVVDGYTTSATHLLVFPAFLSLALLGRIGFVAAVAGCLPRRRELGGLPSWAIAAMTVSVALELVAMALWSAAGQAAAHGVTPDAVVALHAAYEAVNGAIIAPTGLAVLLLAAAMWRSRSFAPWVHWSGVVIGVLIAVPSAVLPLFGLDAEAARAAVPLMWVWMLVVSIIEWRRARPTR